MLKRIESSKLQLEPLLDAAGLHVTVNVENNVENYDGSWSIAPNSPVLFERLAYQLEYLFGKSIANVRQIAVDLKAGRWVLVDGCCARKRLASTGFVEAIGLPVRVRRLQNC
jgi:hypothetical protein